MSNKLKSFLKIFLSIIIWAGLFRPVFSGQACISSETLHIYSVVKFYIDNLKLGVFPLWDPFVMWGEPMQIFLNYAGIFNPIWLVTAGLNAAGASFYQSFLILVTLYFWVGQAGFYLLAKSLLKNSLAAYGAFLLFLFSSVSMSLFAQFHPPLLYIPGIWFFYFLVSFLKKPSRHGWLGLVLTGSIILTSYLPFYFLTVFIFVMTAGMIFYFDRIKTVFVLTVSFLGKNAGFVVLTLGVLALAFFPGYRAYQTTLDKEIVAPFRNENLEKKSGVVFDDYEKIAKNGLGSRMDLEDLYSNFDVIEYGDDGFFYVGLFFYIILLVGMVLRGSRLMGTCALAAFPLFFLMMTSATGFHKFLFEHVGYFKLIRNMHFFLPFFLALLVLFASEQLRLLFEDRKKIQDKYRLAFLAFVVFVHLGAAIFFLRQQNVAISSYWTLGFSLLFWTGFVFGRDGKNNMVLTAALFLSVIVQPLEVIGRHNDRGINVSSSADKAFIQKAVAVSSSKPVFHYGRPVSPEIIGNDHTAYSRIAMKDAPRFFENGFPTFWSYGLTMKVPFEDIQKYTASKFYVYEAVDVLESDGDSEKFAGNFRSLSNVALVSSVADRTPLKVLMANKGQAGLNPVLVIRGPSENFKVVSFDVNSVKVHTRFAQEKFLVYTDSYHKDWKGFVNGQPAVIYRSSMAFKGIRLPAGTNEIVLSYRPPGVAFLSVSLVVALLVVWIYLLWLVIRGK